MSTLTLQQDSDSATDIVVVYRRHIDPAVLDVAGLAAHTVRLGADPVESVAKLYELGARHITLPDPVDLSPEADAERGVRTLVAIREMTAWGIAVDWTLHLGDGDGDGGAGDSGADGEGGAAFAIVNLISHLNPPARITGPPDAETLLATWRSGHFFNECIHRHAPGFIQVRDRRYGELSRITIDDPDYLAVVNALYLPALAADLPEEILADFESENLVGRVGDYAWWVPYRVRRWPMPAMSL